MKHRHTRVEVCVGGGVGLFQSDSPARSSDTDAL